MGGCFDAVTRRKWASRGTSSHLHDVQIASDLLHGHSGTLRSVQGDIAAVLKSRKNGGQNWNLAVVRLDSRAGKCQETKLG